MVAIIKTSNSINTILNYNENKVKKGVANCISAVNYPLELEKLNFTLKLNRFLKRADLNTNAKRNAVHISLNFDPSENHSNEKLNEIARVYMDKIGFGKQPYLVYQHHDAGHPHLHVVTNNIQRDGKRIDLHLLGIRKSEPARKEIEELFGLVKAEGRENKEVFTLQQIDSRKVIYGKMESKKAINGVLNLVLNEYKYSSLPELNAVLNLFNLMADKGKEDTRIFKTNGLVYRILDQNGNPIGVPIKASFFHNKPTLKCLEEKFKANKTKPAFHSKRIKNAIDLALLHKKTTLKELTKILEKQGINIVIRSNKEGLIYGVTYVDHVTKSVFNGSSLGKEYSAKAIQDRCEKRIEKTSALAIQTFVNKNKNQPLSINSITQLIDDLIQTEFVENYIPNQLKKKQKKRKRNGQSFN